MTYCSDGENIIRLFGLIPSSGSSLSHQAAQKRPPAVRWYTLLFRHLEVSIATNEVKRAQISACQTMKQ